MTTKKLIKIKNQFRQGDILIERIETTEAITTDISENGRVILAHGEVTGHAHEIEDASGASISRPQSPLSIVGDLDSQFATQAIITLGRDAKLVHQEHATIELTPGTHRVSRQREYHPVALRTVAD